MIDPKIGIKILLEGPHPALWESAARNETMRFLRLRGGDISKRDLSRLVKTILAGPRRDNFRRMSDEEFAEFSNYSIAFRLFKLQVSGAMLPKKAQRKLDRTLEDLHLQLATDDSDEIQRLMPARWGSINENTVTVDFASMSIAKFSEWAKRQEERSWDCDGGWLEFCELNSDMALGLLKQIAKRGSWPIAPWYDAISRFRQGVKDLDERHHQNVASLIVEMPTSTLARVSTVAAQWFELVRLSVGQDFFCSLWERIWEASVANDWNGEIDFNMTLNHAGGILAIVLINELGDIYPKVSEGENPGFPERLRPYFDIIAREDSPSAKLARTRASGSLLYLFRINRPWTLSALLRRMDPANKGGFESALWEGYLWSPRIHGDLFECLKPMFFGILENLDLIPESVRAHAPQLFTVVAVSPGREITEEEAQEVLQVMPPRYLAQAAWMLQDMLSGAAEDAPVLWRETIEPWFKIVWPRHKIAKCSEVSSQLAQMAVEAGDAFPDAVKTVSDWLRPTKHGETIHYLKESGLTGRFPNEAWLLIRSTVDEDTFLSQSELSELLNEIEGASQLLASDEKFQRLRAKVQ